jgi:nucleotidyltransferase AbiEii toxin of type IV toxin-antitoxin system
VTKKVVTNVPASVFARLKQLAQARQIDVNTILTRYFIERLLYRLAQSPERENFLLKGAMLFAVWNDTPYRPTKDLDLLGRGPDDVDGMIARMASICRTAVSDGDGVVFHADAIVGEPIRSEEEYHGVRLHVPASLGSARTRIQIDIGVGDAAPGTYDGRYPTLLDLPAPHVRMYSREAVVSEKYEAMVSLGGGNSRMKDFSDVWVLQRGFAFDGRALSGAIGETFARRGRPIPDAPPVGLTTEWAGAANQERAWRAFLRRSGLASPERAFADVVATLRLFLLPPAEAARTLHAFRESWPPGGPWTQER